MFCSCQTYPVCRWACVHLFQPARTYAPLRVQHACKFPTQMVWDIVVRTKHRASHTARTGVSRLLKVTGLNDRKRSALKFNHVVQRRRQGTQKCSTPAKTLSGLSEATWQMLRRSVCVCVFVCVWLRTGEELCAALRRPRRCAPSAQVRPDLRAPRCALTNCASGRAGPLLTASGGSVWYLFPFPFACDKIKLSSFLFFPWECFSLHLK